MIISDPKSITTNFGKINATADSKYQDYFGGNVSDSKDKAKGVLIGTGITNGGM